MHQIYHRVGIAAPAAAVYQALTTDSGLSRWWTSDTRGAGAEGSHIRFGFGGVGIDFEVAELQPNARVLWRHAGEVPESWMDTEVSFDLAEGKGQTYVHFAHSDWKEKTDFMGHCSIKWAVFLLSLKDLLEQGQGRPFPNDVSVDHD